jgi:hypothetical protein
VYVSVYTARPTGFNWIDYKRSALRWHIAFALLNTMNVAFSQHNIIFSKNKSTCSAKNYKASTDHLHSCN